MGSVAVWTLQATSLQMQGPSEEQQQQQKHLNVGVMKAAEETGHCSRH